MKEEFYGSMDRIIGKLISMFEERTSSLQTLRGATEMTIMGDLDVGTSLQKRRRTHSVKDEEVEATNLGNGS